MRVRSTRAVLAGLLLASFGCDPAPTQIIVHVDAQDELRAQTQNLRIRVWGRGFDTPFEDTLFQEETAVAEDGRVAWPWRVDLRPGNGDPTRIWRIEAAAYSGAAPGSGETDIAPGLLAVARSSAGYEEGRIQHVFLQLYDACIGVQDPCLDPDTTCDIDGRCVDIPDPLVFDPEAGLPDGGRLDAGPECGPPRSEACNGQDDDCDGSVDEEFDLNSDVNRCGECDRVCSAPNAIPSCSAGLCEYACQPGTRECEGACVRIDADGCEACGVACPSDRPLCSGGTCVATCPAGQEACGEGECIDTGGDDVAHCGACDRACEARGQADAVCNAGSCAYTCQDGFEDCNDNLNSEQATPGAEDGCEADLNVLATCGGCEPDCPSNAPCVVAICADRSCGQAFADGAMCPLAGGCMGECSAGACIGMCDGDAGPPDAGTDAGPPDAGTDAGPPDAGTDAGPPDAGPPDAGPPDAGTDAGPPDPPDGGMSIDAGGGGDDGGGVDDGGIGMVDGGVIVGPGV